MNIVLDGVPTLGPLVAKGRRVGMLPIVPYVVRDCGFDVAITK